jgi:hypothetical protein
MQGLIIREALEFKLHPTNMNRDDGFFLTRVLKPLTHMIKDAMSSS